MGLFQIKPDIHYGANSLDILRTLEMEKVFLVTDENMVKLKVTNKVVNILKSREIETKIYSDVKPDPTDEEIINGMLELSAYNPDCIIALGGGSPIDACKSMIYFTNQIKKAIGQNKKPKFIAIPTTSGTGSEVTSYAVVTTKDKKIPLSDSEMLPDIAILNPEFIKTLPPSIIADTGMDVLTHAIEAYVSRSRNLFTNTLALGAIKTVFADLVSNFENPRLERERIDLQIASCMAGAAFSNAGLGINHSIAHSLGARFHKPHGRLNAVIMPKVIKFNAQNKNAARYYREIAEALGFTPKEDAEGVEMLAKAIKMRAAKMGIPNNLRELGIPEEQYFSEMENIIDQIENDLCTGENPRRFNRIEMKQLLKDLY